MKIKAKRGRKPKLTADDVAEIRRMYAIKDKPWSVPQIARQFACSTSTVNKALNGTLPLTPATGVAGT